ncbi:hypothetical protein [Granulicella paludicola]|uniref:hypothetical protein n=1 Tax=Granulicella paludicola TaxID=474951 RepID=UPI0021DF5537|nr:hypothetical protein [Granulicella paludicola]
MSIERTKSTHDPEPFSSEDAVFSVAQAAKEERRRSAKIEQMGLARYHLEQARARRSPDTLEALLIRAIADAQSGKKFQMKIFNASGLDQEELVDLPLSGLSMVPKAGDPVMFKGRQVAVCSARLSYRPYREVQREYSCVFLDVLVDVE